MEHVNLVYTRFTDIGACWPGRTMAMLRLLMNLMPLANLDFSETMQWRIVCLPCPGISYFVQVPVGTDNIMQQFYNIRTIMVCGNVRSVGNLHKSPSLPPSKGIIIRELEYPTL